MELIVNTADEMTYINAIAISLKGKYVHFTLGHDHSYSFKLSDIDSFDFTHLKERGNVYDAMKLKLQQALRITKDEKN